MTNVVVLAAEVGGPAVEGRFLTPLGEHELLLFWVQLFVLLATARLLGGAAKRLGQPAVVGELLAGVLLGPSVLGRAAPDLAGWLFPGGEVESALLLAVAWLGIFLLLVVTGFETDLGLLRRLGRPAVNVSVGSLVVPLGLGVALGWAMPSDYFGAEGGRLGFALFMGIALSISALPVVAKILADMQLLRRDFAQITVAAGMANDVVGWLLLGGVVGIFTSGDVDLGSLALTFGLVSLFLTLALTVGQRVADQMLRRARGSADSFSGALTATILLALLFGAVTQAIGVEAVLGALVAGIVLSRSKYRRRDVEHTIESLSGSIFAPVFFATAGLYVDFAVLLEGDNLLWTAAVILVATLAKLLGSYAGARTSGLSRIEGLAIGIGLNARGALEIVVATLGFALGALNDASYAMVVAMAIVTSVVAPMLLRPVLQRMHANPDEQARLEREELLSDSVVASAENVLLPTRGGRNSIEAARLLDLTLQPSTRVTVLTVGDGPPDTERVDEVVDALEDHEVERRAHVAEDAAEDVLQEAGLGYDLLALGLNDDFAGSHRLSPALGRMIAGSPVPVLLVRRGRHAGEDGPEAAGGFRRIMVPVTGTRLGRAAEEVAYVLGSRMGAEVDAVHVAAATDGQSAADAPQPAHAQLERSRELAARFGGGASTALRTTGSGIAEHEELLDAAEENGSDLIVIGAMARSADGAVPFLGYAAEYVLEHSRATVVAVIFPADGP